MKSRLGCLPGIWPTGDSVQGKAVQELSHEMKQYIKMPLGFSYVLPEEEETIQNYETDLETYFNSAFTAFVRGTRGLSDEEWNHYLKEVEQLHEPEVTAVMQAMADRNAR